MNELVWLLLPIAAASGWLAARRNGRQEDSRTPFADNNPAYFKGLNHLLNEEPDQAIDVFVRLLQVDSDTLETHVALGNLFRRRGEVERAIRIHQNLIARPALTREQRGLALFELGQDYLRAGLFDRAEALFKDLRDKKLHLEPVLRNLKQIYQQEKDWESCLAVSEALQPLVSEALATERAHYYCELAREAQCRRDSAQAEVLLKKALAADKACTRAVHMRASLAAARRDFREAIRFYRKAADIDPDYFPELLRELIEAHKRLGDVSGLKAYLEKRFIQHPNASSELVLVELVKETEGEAAAVAFLSERIRTAPSLKSLFKLLDLHAQVPNAEASRVLLGVRQQIQQLLYERPQYQCRRCGFSAKTLHWQCPSCRSWGSLKRHPELEACVPVNS